MKMIFNLKEGSSEPGGGGGSRERHETPLEPPQECHTKNCQGMPRSKELSATAKQRFCQGLSNKISASEYNNQKYWQGMSRLRYVQRVP